MAKVLITEQLHPAGPELLRAQGHQVVFFENLGGKTLEEALADADAVLVRISELRGELLKDAKHLKVISKHGVGVDNIDLDLSLIHILRCRRSHNIRYRWSTYN